MKRIYILIIKIKGKQLVYFDNQNLNSLCSCHHYVNCSCLFCVSMGLWKHDFQPISVHIFLGQFSNKSFLIKKTSNLGRPYFCTKEKCHINGVQFDMNFVHGRWWKLIMAQEYKLCIKLSPQSILHRTNLKEWVGYIQCCKLKVSNELSRKRFTLSMICIQW